MPATAFPLEWPAGWPRTEPSARTNNGNLRKTTANVARGSLYDELKRLGAKNVVLSTNIPLRNDGEFYAEQRPLDNEPGVAVYFELRGRPMSMARDSYQTLTQNLRSLGLAIEYMRGLERHGGAHMMEKAFAGFAALPPPDGSTTSTPQVDWRKEFAPLPKGIENQDMLAIVNSRYLAKSKTAHADHGGGGETMLRLNLAIAQARKELA